MRRIRIPSVLSAVDTEEMEHMYMEALVRGLLAFLLHLH